MKNPIVSVIIVIGCLLSAAVLRAEPIDFKELSLLVRANESESSIMQDVSQRKLLYPLNQQQEATLKAQGASDSLIRSVRDSRLILSKDEAAAIETKRQQRAERRAAADRRSEAEASNAEISVFDVAVDHPVNLSQWGGPDCEFTFSSERILGENVVVPSITNHAGTYTDVSRYVGFGAAGWEFTPSEYVAVSSHEARRPVHIDMQNPVWIKGVPYALYPIYGAGGVSLYYVGATTYSVRLAVSTH